MLLLLDTEIFGYRLDSDPEEREFYITCKKCNKVQIDNGLSNSFKCKRCGNIIEIDEEDDNRENINNIFDAYQKSKSKKTNKKSIIMNLTFSAFNSHKYPKIPNELTSLVLIVNKDTLLGNFYSDDQEAISYETVMKKILLPYFKIKSRIIERGTKINIGELEFKVIGTFPDVSGIVSSKTFIRCNKYYTANCIIKRALLITTKKYENFDKNEIIKEINSASLDQLQITKGDIAKIKNYEFYIRNAEPECGRIAPSTDLSIENKEISSIAKIKFGVIQRNPPTYTNVTEKRGYENYIIQEYFNPYFLSGIKKYIERGDSVKIEDIEFFVLNSHPDSGYISQDTLTSFKLGISKEKCLEKIKKADNQLALGLMSLNNARSASPLRTREIDDFIIREIMGNAQRHLNFDDLDINIITEESISQQKLEEDIRALPTFKVDEAYMKKIESNTEECMKKCVICMEEFAVGDDLKTLPCFHIFHGKCVNQWLMENMNCPVCKMSINPSNGNSNIYSMEEGENSMIPNINFDNSEGENDDEQD